MGDPILLGVVELAAALGVRPAFLDPYLNQAGPMPVLATFLRTETPAGDRGPRVAYLPFFSPWQARAAALYVALGRSPGGLHAASWAPLAWAGRGGALPEHAWVKCEGGRVELREEPPFAYVSGSVPVALAGVEARLVAAFAAEALSLSDWREIAEYHGAKLVDAPPVTLPASVIAHAMDPKGVDRKGSRDLLSALYGSTKGPRRRVVVVEAPGERGVDPDDAAEALAA